MVPTYVLTSDFFGKSTARDKSRPLAEFADKVRAFTREKHIPVIKEWKKGVAPWTTFKGTEEGKAYLKEIVRLTGVTTAKLSDRDWRVTEYTNLWETRTNVSPGKCEPDRAEQEGFMNALKPGFSYNQYDTRMVIEGSVNYDFEYAEDNAFKAEMARFLPKYLNYNNNAEYIASSELTNRDVSNLWDWKTNRGGVSKTSSNTLTDITLTINTAPGLKFIVTHGYFDVVTPFFQTELDLGVTVKVNGADVRLSDRIPVHTFEGGHMVYFVENERAALKQAMDDFYDAPPYSPPTAAPVQKSAALQCDECHEKNVSGRCCSNTIRHVNGGSHAAC